MTDAKLKSLVDKAVALDLEIREKAEELKELKAAMVVEAQGRDEEQTPTDGGGRAWTYQGTAGAIARVTFPAPTLKSSIRQGSKTLVKAMEMAGGVFAKLFLQEPAYVPVAEFRVEAAALLDKPTARKLIALVSTDSPPRVSFETKPEEG